MILSRFFKEIFQDSQDGFSSKRAAVAFILILIAACVLAAVFWQVNVPETIYNGLIDLAKWIFAFILGEKAPDALMALNGKLPDTPKSPFATADDDEPATIVDSDR